MSSVLLSGVSANHAEWRSVHSLSSAVFLVFALGIWTRISLFPEK